MRMLVAPVVVLFALTADAGVVVERFLSPDRPQDVVIIDLIKLAQEKKATSKQLTDLAVLVTDRGFANDAEDFFKQALRTDKKNHEAAYRLGLLLQREGRERAAMRYYRKTIKLRPGHAQARFMLALALERRGHRNSAVYNYAKAYKHAPELADPLYNPLVNDSELQTEALLLRYQREAVGTTFPITLVDPGAVRSMLEAARNREATSAGPVPTSPVKVTDEKPVQPVPVMPKVSRPAPNKPQLPPSLRPPAAPRSPATTPTPPPPPSPATTPPPAR
jgi:hypothetical protein